MVGTYVPVHDHDLVQIRQVSNSYSDKDYFRKKSGLAAVSKTLINRDRGYRFIWLPPSLSLLYSVTSVL